MTNDETELTVLQSSDNSPVSSSLWPLNKRSEDAFFTGLASIWSNIFTNSNEKKTCLYEAVFISKILSTVKIQLCLLVIQLCPFVIQLCLLVIQLLNLIMPAWHSVMFDIIFQLLLDKKTASYVYYSVYYVYSNFKHLLAGISEYFTLCRGLTLYKCVVNVCIQR